MKEAWVIFRGQIVSAEGDMPEAFNDVDQVVEVVRAEKISKSYVKLLESPFYHPNVSFGDILKVEPSKKELNEKIAIIEFSGVCSESDDTLFESGLGTTDVGLDAEKLDEMICLDKQAKPVMLDKYNQGLVYEPVKLISHGSYKINVSYSAETKDDLNNLKNYFNTFDAVFQTSSNKKFGSVGFSKETKFETAVKCLEDAPGVIGCYIAFNPKEFPSIGFSEDLIPREKEEGDNE